MTVSVTVAHDSEADFQRHDATGEMLREASMGKEEEERVQEGEGEEKEEDEEDEEDGFVSRHARAVRAQKPDKLYSDVVSEKLKSLEEGGELEDYEWKQVMAPQSGDVASVLPLVIQR